MSHRLLFPFILVLAAVLVAGCSYQPARIKSQPLVVIDDGHGGHSHGSRFCPPGQAKKGRC
jgi:type IV secretory pathway TrbF-like protein